MVVLALGLVIWSMIRGTGSKALFMNSADTDVKIENIAEKGKAQIFYKGKLAAELPNAWGEYQVNLLRRTKRHAYFEHCLKEARGYLLFGVCPRHIYRLDLESKEFINLLGAQPSPLDLAEDVSADERYLAVGSNSLLEGKSKLFIVIKPLAEGEEQPLAFPIAEEYKQLGDIHFSPDGSKVAYAVASGDLKNEKGAVVVLELVNGRHTTIVKTTEPKTYYRVFGWKPSGEVQYELRRVEETL